MPEGLHVHAQELAKPREPVAQDPRSRARRQVAHENGAAVIWIAPGEALLLKVDAQFRIDQNMERVTAFEVNTGCVSQPPLVTRFLGRNVLWANMQSSERMS